MKKIVILIIALLLIFALIFGFAIFKPKDIIKYKSQDIEKITMYRFAPQMGGPQKKNITDPSDIKFVINMINSCRLDREPENMDFKEGGYPISFDFQLKNNDKFIIRFYDCGPPIIFFNDKRRIVSNCKIGDLWSELNYEIITFKWEDVPEGVLFKVDEIS